MVASHCRQKTGRGEKNGLKRKRAQKESRSGQSRRIAKSINWQKPASHTGYEWHPAAVKAPGKLLRVRGDSFPIGDSDVQPSLLCLRQQHELRGSKPLDKHCQGRL